MHALIRPVGLATLALASLAAQAHISYTGRNFGALTAGSSLSISNQATTGNYGWIDAADWTLAFDPSAGSTATTDNLLLGDSHKGRAFRFHLDTALTVTITAAANAGATATSIGGLLPGFSVYQGLAAVAPFTAPQTSPDHDFNPASEAWRSGYAQSRLGSGYDFNATQGSWNALGNWQVGGDGDPAGVGSALSSFSFRGFGYDWDRDGSATAILALDAGDYTVFVGGTDIANKAAATAGSAFGLSLTVSAVPESQTAALMLAGLGALAMVARRGRLPR